MRREDEALLEKPGFHPGIRARLEGMAVADEEGELGDARRNFVRLRRRGRRDLLRTDGAQSALEAMKAYQEDPPFEDRPVCLCIVISVIGAINATTPNRSGPFA
jgi:hypothetical protein